MRTVSMWAYSGGNREVSVHDVDPDLFEKLRPAFDKLESHPKEGVGRIVFDEDTSIMLFRKLDDDKKEVSDESTVEDVENGKPFC